MWQTFTVPASELEVNDELSDGTYVENVYHDPEGVWLDTNGAYEDTGYVDYTTKFKVTRYYDE